VIDLGEYGRVLLFVMFVGRDLNGKAKNATEALTSRGRSRSRSEWGGFSVATDEYRAARPPPPAAQGRAGSGWADAAAGPGSGSGSGVATSLRLSNGITCPIVWSPPRPAQNEVGLLVHVAGARGAAMPGHLSSVSGYQEAAMKSPETCLRH